MLRMTLEVFRSCGRCLATGMFITVFANVSLAADESEQQEDLEKWRTIGSHVWRFDDLGAEAGPDTENGMLVTTVPYRDFHLSVEFWIEDDTNSGVFLRCQDPVEFADINADNCYEANIWDNHPNQDFRSGSIVRFGPPKSKVDTLGRWNRYEIDVRGSAITVTLNGEETAAINDNALAAGYIALQYAGDGLLRFRNVRITAY
mgnify:CR=1 FL=1